MRFRRRYKRRLRFLAIWGTWAAILIAGAGYLAVRFEAVKFSPQTHRTSVRANPSAPSARATTTTTVNLSAKAPSQTIQSLDATPSIFDGPIDPPSSNQITVAPSKAGALLTQLHPQIDKPPLTPIATRQEFFDDFEGDTLDTTKWRIAKRQWAGGGVNGGVVPRNVWVADGNLVLEAHGDLYNGPVTGINKYGVARHHGKRVGGAVATKHYFASGRYEVRAKIAPDLGACSSFAAMHYQELYPGQQGYEEAGGDGYDVAIVNHEIDIELAGRPRASAIYDVSFEYCLANTWRGQRRSQRSDTYVNIGQPQNDGQYHTYRFDWYTGDGNTESPPKVEFYIDDQLIQTITTNIPTRGSRFWASVWFPYRWAGVPSFIQSRMYVDWVRITPFNQPNDEWVPESYADDGWAAEDEYPPHNDADLTARADTHRRPRVITKFSKRDQEEPLGTMFNSFSAYPSNANAGITDEESYDDSGYALQVNYLKKRGYRHFCGVWVRLAEKDRYLDATDYRYLTFYIKGKRGRENFNIGLADRAWSQEKDDAKLVGNIYDFLPNGVTRQWQKVRVPLDPVLRLDFQQITQLALIFRLGRGEVYIDHIALEG